MAKQISLIFEPRGKTKSETEIHANLCRQGLIFYSVYSRMDLSHEDRENLLKLILGATDCVLNPAPGTDSTLCRCLAGELMHTLYDIWLYSETKNAHLWGILKESYSKWTYLVETVNEWAASVKGLLSYIIDELYYPEKKTKTIRIACGCFSTTLELTPDYIHYVWNRVVPLLGDTDAIRDSEPHRLAMIGFANAIQMLLDVVTAEVPGAPDANTILDVFGRDLFKATYTLQPKHEAGTAIAISTLCRVFTTCRAAAADKRYLAAYYNAIGSCLTTSETNAVLVNTLQSTEPLLAQGLPGARLLVPHYVRMLERVAASPLLAEKNRNGKGEALISSCINVISMILSMGTRYQAARFPQPLRLAGTAAAAATPSLPDIASYDDLEAHLGFILLNLLGNPTLLPGTRESVLWQSYVFLREYLPSTTEYGIINTKTPDVGLQVAPRFAWAFLKHVLKKICDNAWPLPVVKTALEVLGTVATLYEHLVEPATYAAHVVENLSHYITDKIVNGLKADSIQTTLVVISFDVATRWAMAGTWLADARPVFAHLVDTCLTCTGHSARAHLPTQPPQVAEAALKCFFTVINRWSVFPSTAGPTRVSPLLNEEMFLRKTMERYGLSLPDALSCARHYALGNSALVTFLDVPELSERDGLTAIVILRDRTGKYIWRAQFQALAPDEAAATANPSKGGDSSGARKEQCVVPHRSEALHANSDAANAAEATQMWMQELYSSLEAIGVENMSQPVHALTEAQAKFGAESRYFLAEDVTLKAPVREAVASLLARDPARYIGGRALSTQLGYLTPYGKAALTPLKPSSDFYEEIRSLDGLPERDTLRIAVMYQTVGMGEREALSIGVDKCSANFCDFVGNLGWFVDTATHAGFLGGLDRKGSFGKRTLYYSDYATEVAFHVAPFIVNESGDKLKPGDENGWSEQKRRMIANDYVLIVWSDDDSYDETAFPNMNQNVKIVISPIPRADGLYKVVVHRSDRLRTSPGPLRGTMVVSKRALAPLVRITAISGHYSVTEIAECTTQPLAVRQAKITDIVSRYKAAVPPVQFFESQFFYDANNYSSVSFPPRRLVIKQQQQQSRPANVKQAAAPPPSASAAYNNVMKTSSSEPTTSSPLGTPSRYPQGASNVQQQQQYQQIPPPSSLQSQQQQQIQPSRVDIGPPSGPPPPSTSSAAVHQGDSIPPPNTTPPPPALQAKHQNVGDIPPPSTTAAFNTREMAPTNIQPSKPAHPPAGPSATIATALMDGTTAQSSYHPLQQQQQQPQQQQQMGAAIPPQQAPMTSPPPITSPPPMTSALPPQQQQQQQQYQQGQNPPVIQKRPYGVNYPPPHGAAPSFAQGNHSLASMAGNRPTIKTCINANIKNSPILQKQYAHQSQGMSGLQQQQQQQQYTQQGSSSPSMPKRSMPPLGHAPPVPSQ